MPALAHLHLIAEPQWVLFFCGHILDINVTLLRNRKKRASHNNTSCTVLRNIAQTCLRYHAKLFIEIKTFLYVVI